MTLYGQNKEDATLLALFENFKTGTILDIGAFTGTQYSNSLALIEKGWGGLMIEPSPDAFRQLMKLHAGRPHVHLVNALIMPEATPGKLVRFAVTNDAVSTADKEWEEIWSKAATYQPIYCPEVSMSALGQLAEELHLSFDCLSLDTEGMTLDLAKAWLKEPRLSSRTRVACVEHSGAGRCDLPALDELFAAWTKVEVNGENVIYSRSLP